MTSEEFKIQVLPWSRKLYPMIRRYLRSDAETQDAVQELMLKLWDKRELLDKIGNRDGYILRMAKNHCLDVMKKSKARLLEDNEERMILRLPGHEADYETSERLEQVHRVIGGLPEKYRQVIQYRDIDGFEFDEMAELTGYEAPYLRVLLSRARGMVKTEIEKIYRFGIGKHEEMAAMERRREK